VGDVVKGVPELTPVAVKAGHLLARRLFAKQSGVEGGGFAQELMDYERVCTTVFTPVEYSCCGLTEEEALARYGDKEGCLDVHHTSLHPLEANLSPVPYAGGGDFGFTQSQAKKGGYCKAISVPAEGGRVVGLHYLGPHAGEVMQGFGVAMRMGMTIRDLQSTVGIHPTSAESVVKLRTTKTSGEDVSQPGC
jgi:thioredoxin reductase (NADPH)